MKFYLQSVFFTLAALAGLSLSASPMDPQNYPPATLRVRGTQTVRLWVLDSNSPKGNVTLLRVLNELEKYLLVRDPENCCGLRPYVDALCGLGEAESLALFYLSASQPQSALPRWSTEDLLYYFDDKISAQELIARQAPLQEDGALLLAPEIDRILGNKLQPIQEKLNGTEAYGRECSEGELIESLFGFKVLEAALRRPDMDANRPTLLPFYCLDKKAVYRISTPLEAADPEPSIPTPYVRYSISKAESSLEGDTDNKMQYKGAGDMLGLRWRLDPAQTRHSDWPQENPPHEAEAKQKIISLVRAHFLENPARLQLGNPLKVEVFYLCANDSPPSTLERVRNKADEVAERFNSAAIQYIPAVVSSAPLSPSEEVIRYTDASTMYISEKEWQLEAFFEKIKQLPPLSPEVVHESALARLQASQVTSNGFQDALSLELNGLPLKNMEVCTTLGPRLSTFNAISTLELNRCKLGGIPLRNLFQQLTTPGTHPLQKVRIADESLYLSSEELRALIEAWNLLYMNRIQGASFEVESLNDPTVVGPSVVDSINNLLTVAPAFGSKNSIKTFLLKNTEIEKRERARLQELNRLQAQELSDFIPEKKTLIIHPKR